MFYFFRNFLAWVEYERNSGVKFYFPSFGLNPPVLAKNNAGKRFYNFSNFLDIFFGIFFPRSSMNGILESNFVFIFLAYLLGVLSKNNARKRFYNFLNFFTIFFRNFLSWVEYERNFGVKFRFHFFGLSPPVLAKNNAAKRFYNFLNFFPIFSGIFLPGSSMNGILE